MVIYTCQVNFLKWNILELWKFLSSFQVPAFALNVFVITASLSGVKQFIVIRLTWEILVTFSSWFNRLNLSVLQEVSYRGTMLWIWLSRLSRRDCTRKSKFIRTEMAQQKLQLKVVFVGAIKEEKTLSWNHLWRSWYEIHSEGIDDIRDDFFFTYWLENAFHQLKKFVAMIKIGCNVDGDPKV